MKKQLLIASISVLAAFTSNAQCNITSSCTPSTTSGYCTNPLQGSDLPNATVGVSYSTVIQVSIGSTAMNGAINMMGVTVNSADLPAGLTYSTNPMNGVVPAGTDACIEISGTPTTEWNNFNVVFEVTAMTDQGNVDQSINFDIDVIAGTASISSIENSMSISAFPNPTKDQLKIHTPNSTTLVISDLLGNVIKQIEINEQVTLDVSSWKNSIYFIRDMKSGNTIKFVKK